MFFRRPKTPQAPPETAVPAKEVAKPVIPDDHGERALDTLGSVLRAFGDFAFDTERESALDIKARSADIIRRVVLGDVREPDAKDPTISVRPVAMRRDWGAAHRFVSEQRKYERDYVSSSLGNLSQAVREFAQCLSAAICEDRASDGEIVGQLVRLETAAKHNDTDAIRREALAMSTTVKQAMAKRRERENAQLLQLGKQVKNLRQELEKARAQAVVDPLTQLYNRAAFDQEIDTVARLGLLLGSEPCLVIADADHFKQVNDKYGHPIGDVVLRAVADNLVRHFLRKEDFVTRYGGEEFAIVIRDSTIEKVASRVERAREVLAQTPVKTSAGPVSVTMSCGVAVFVPGETPQSWIGRADKALYSAKAAGRNRVELAPDVPSMSRISIATPVGR